MEMTREQTIRVKIGLRIRELREAQGLSIRKLADMAGINYRYLFDIEHAVSSPTVDRLVRISDALDVSLSQLFHDL